MQTLSEVMGDRHQFVDHCTIKHRDVQQLKGITLQNIASGSDYLFNSAGTESSFLHASSEVDIDSVSGQYVLTEDLEQAMDLLEERGKVVLCGPPGCGKTTLAYALLRRNRESGFKPYIFTRVDEWYLHVVEGKRCIVLMDGLFGTTYVNKAQHKCWRAILQNVQELTKRGNCKLILTVYPHILRELQILDVRSESPFTDTICVLYLDRTTLITDIKKSMVRFHLKELCLDQDTMCDIIERVLQKDVSGSVFPWCCRQMAVFWHSTEDPTGIFASPAEAYVPLLQLLTHDNEYGDIFAAVLALTMLGKGNFLLNPLRVQSDLLRLGLSTFCDDRLEKCAYFLKGSILSETGKGFYNRILYDAAGLALGRSFRLPMLLKVCDLNFFVKYIRMKQTATQLSVPVGPQLEEMQLLVVKIYKEIMEGHLPEISQHPCLQCLKFLDMLHSFCQTEQNVFKRLLTTEPSVRRLLTVVDPVHRLPLLYWSTFSSSHNLTKWCLTVMDDKKTIRTCLPQILLAWSVFRQWSAKVYQQLYKLIKDMSISIPKIFGFPTCRVLVPVPKPEQCITDESTDVLKFISDLESEQRQLTYQDNPAFPIPTTVVSVRVLEEGIFVQITDKDQWYTVLRVLTEGQVNHIDDNNNTLLWLAYESKNMDVAALVLKSHILNHFSHAAPMMPCILEGIALFCFTEHPLMKIFRHIFFVIANCCRKELKERLFHTDNANDADNEVTGEISDNEDQNS